MPRKQSDSTISDIQEKHIKDEQTATAQNMNENHKTKKESMEKNTKR